MRTDQDLLKEHMQAGDTSAAAQFLQYLTKRDRGALRRYPDKKTKEIGKSGDWQITRSHATRALIDGEFDDHGLLALHIRDAFQARDGDTLAARKARAIEVFEACLEAAENIDEDEERNFFVLVDAAADYAISEIQNGRFPTRGEVIKKASQATGLKITSATEGTRILQCARLSFLLKAHGKRSY
jgi:hypothetical protein